MIPSNKIQDDLTDLPISRAKKFRIRCKRRGLCQCGKPRLPESKSLCEKCLLYQRVRKRKLYAYKKWEPGSPGPKPLPVKEP